MRTRLVVVYACAVWIIHRARPGVAGGSLIDLACGPGHYTLCLARYLDLENVVGIDLSRPMVEVAEQNAAEQDLSDRVQFRVGDVTQLEGVKSNEFHVSSFAHGAHHMPDLATVNAVLREMDRITKPDGLVMVLDLVRLKGRALTERYVHLPGHDYVDLGLPEHLETFRNSMYAAWTAKELRGAIPKDTSRYWCHLVPRGLPTVQLVLGLPVGRRKLFKRSGPQWGLWSENPIPPEMEREYGLLRTSLRYASRHWIHPAHND